MIALYTVARVNKRSLCVMKLPSIMQLDQQMYCPLMLSSDRGTNKTYKTDTWHHQQGKDFDHRQAKNLFGEGVNNVVKHREISLWRGPESGLAFSIRLNLQAYWNVLYRRTVSVKLIFWTGLFHSNMLPAFAKHIQMYSKSRGRIGRELTWLHHEVTSYVS